MSCRRRHLCCFMQRGHLGRRHDCSGSQMSCKTWVTGSYSASLSWIDVPADINILCYLISISLEGVDYRRTPERFWTTFGREIALALGDPNMMISCQRDFLDAFAASPGGPRPRNERVVILLDEFSELYKAKNSTRNEVLRAIRRIKQAVDTYTISSIIAAGTFSIVHLNPTPHQNISPFNVSDAIQSPNFSREETERLFNDFARDKSITIDDEVVSYIWDKSNGCVVGICPAYLILHLSVAIRAWSAFVDV